MKQAKSKSVTMEGDSASTEQENVELSRQEEEDLINRANFGENYHPLITASELPTKTEFEIEHLALKMTKYGEGACATITFEDEKRNLFLSKHFAEKHRYESLQRLFKADNRILAFKIDKFEIRDKMKVPYYEFFTKDEETGKVSVSYPTPPTDAAPTPSKKKK